MRKENTKKKKKAHILSQNFVCVTTILAYTKQAMSNLIDYFYMICINTFSIRLNHILLGYFLIYIYIYIYSCNEQSGTKFQAERRGNKVVSGQKEDDSTTRR